MDSSSITSSHEIDDAYAGYNRRVTIQNIRIGCYLGMILMPAGVLLDAFVYPQHLWYFFFLRLLCSALIALFYAIVVSPFGARHHRVLGVTLAMFPSFFIAWMIYETEGVASPYYAGLNLVLLVIGFVLQWSFAESITAVSLVIFLYLTACFARGLDLVQTASLVNNLYFLILTGIIMVTGNAVHNRLRYREFALRYQLDQNKQQLEENNRKLVEMDQVKSRFFANISHELRTPLTLLIAPLESLLHQRTPLSSAEAAQMLGTMHVNSMRLLKLINDLLDLVRLESGRMQVKLDPVDVGQFIQGILASVAKLAQDKRVQLVADTKTAVGLVRTDRDKLEKVLLNLVFNSIKFTPAGGQITVSTHRDDNRWILTVADTGMGISPQQLPFIFDRFWQADSSSQRRYQGVGIGLALVKDLVEVQGGTVSVDSAHGKGTRMTLSFPWLPADLPPLQDAPPLHDGAREADPEPDTQWLSDLYRRAELFPSIQLVREAARTATAPVRSNNGAAKILIADDEPGMLRFLHSQLAPHFEIIEASDGLEAIEKAGHFLPDLILLDMMMPEKDGLEVCHDLRQKTSTQNIPTVLLTARADEETKIAALNAGASDFLTKPFSTTELHVRVKNLIAAYQWQRRLARQNQILEATLEQLKETEAQLVQSEKLASLGRLSAGIIHEINNPINFSKTGLFMLRKKNQFLPESQQEDFDEIIGDIEEGIERVRSIVTDLRSFTHPQTNQDHEVDLHRVVAAAKRFLSNELDRDIQLDTQIPPDLQVTGNQNQLVQVLINLLQNSIDAVKSKTYAPPDQPLIQITAHASDQIISLSVKDNGPGIELEHQGKIFDPFFTTKDIGQGTGLGLSICYRIIQDHGGRVLLNSSPGQATEFVLEFPLNKPHPEPIQPI